MLRVVAFWPHAWHYLYPSQILRFQTLIDPAIVIFMFILLFIWFFCFYRLLCITVGERVIKRRWLESFFVVIELRWEVIVRLVDIIGLFDHYCLNFLFINCPMLGVSLVCSLYRSGLFSLNMSGCNDRIIQSTLTRISITRVMIK